MPTSLALDVEDPPLLPCALFCSRSGTDLARGESPRLRTTITHCQCRGGDSFCVVSQLGDGLIILFSETALLTTKAPRHEGSQGFSWCLRDLVVSLRTVAQRFLRLGRST